MAKSHTLIIEEWWYWMLYIILATGVGIILAINRRNISRSADIQGLKLAKANKVARKRLKLAGEFMAKGDNEKFYEEMLRATWGYLSDKLSIPASQLSRDNVAIELTKFGASESLTTDLISVLDDCEMARYAPTASHEEVERIYNKATSTIKELENIKKSRK